MLSIPSFGLDRDNRILFYSQLLMHLGVGLQIVLWPLYIASLGATPVLIGLVIGGVEIIRTVLVIPAGTLSDRLSTRTMILATTAMMVPGGAIIAIAQNWWQALAGGIETPRREQSARLFRRNYGACCRFREAHAYTIEN
jgi:MFS family permease